MSDREVDVKFKEVVAKEIRNLSEDVPF